MSQPRMRKVVASGEAVVRARPSVAKASGDSGTSTVCPNQETQRSRSKNKIPKSVRYDLENALVSLCDVWFEEIKPHLLRNNIKLHVHGSIAGGDHERPPPAALPAPPAPAAAALPATNCSHLDPGAAPDHPQPKDASCAGCCLTPPTALRVPCPRPRVPSRQRHLSLPQSSSQIHDCTQIQSHNCEVKQLKRPRTRRKNRRPKPQPQSNWRVPRLCRTYSILSPATTGSHMRRIASQQPPQLPRDDYYQFNVLRRNTVVKNKSTQTEKASLPPCLSVGCQCGVPTPALCSSLLVRRVGSRSRAFDTTAQPPQPPAPIRSIYRLKSSKTSIKESSLFHDDLIDIIGERNDMRLRLLYSSPEKDDCLSLLNLVALPHDRQKKPGSLKKSPPWR